VILGTVSVAPAPLVVTLDSPFVFLIRDIETDAILFAGRVMNPAA
jgi:serine protease inhibitor